MNRIIFSLLIWFSGLSLSNAQAYEIGLNLGAGNYIGDIGQEYYFKPNKISFGGVFKRTVNPWFSIRLNLNYFKIYANDAEAESLGRRSRLLSADGNIFNFSTGFEYNFVPRNPFLPIKSLHHFTPYLFLGVGIGYYYGHMYKKSSVNNTYNFDFSYSGTNLNIPMILGIKYRASRHIIFSLESGAYYFFTDNLDGTGSFYRNIDTKTGKIIIPSTNIHSNDWYTFSSFGLIYTFGDLNCYFNLF